MNPLLVLLLAPPAVVQAPIPAEAIALGGHLAFETHYFPDETAGTTGFLITDARLILKSRVLDHTEFFVQANLILQPALLDLRLSWFAHEALTVDVGYLKVPISAEFLLPAAEIDFTERHTAYLKLGFGRQTGVQLRGDLAGGLFDYKVGAFNGSGLENEDGRFALAARLGSTLPLGEGELAIATNGGWSHDDAGSVGLFPGFTGKRAVVGGDFRYTLDGLWLGGELLWGHLTPEGADSVNPWGYHASLGYVAADHHMAMVQVRYEAFESDGVGPDLSFVVVGAGINLDPVFSIYIDAYVPPDDPGKLGTYFTAQAYW